MRVAIRTTCGRAIGFGHLRRTLTLAEELTRRGHDVVFWIAGDDSGVTLAAGAGQAAEPIAAGHEPLMRKVESTQPAIVVLDDYAITAADFAALRALTKVAIVDDLADRELTGDLVLNGNADATQLPYRTPPECVRLLGPAYSLLRRPFRDRPSRRAAAEVARALVLFGGSDPRGLSARAAQAILATVPAVAVDVVIGPLATQSAELSALATAAGARVRVHHAPEYLAALMADAELAVSAGGQTNYELAALGVPTVSICVADNQRGNLEALAAAGTLKALFADDAATLTAAVAELARDRDLRQRMIDHGQRLVDGRGAERAAAALEELSRKSDA